MGAPCEVICRTCKTTYYLGYGGHVFRENAVVNIFDHAAHKDHDWFRSNNDNTRQIGDDLYVDHPWYTAAELAEDPDQFLLVKDYFKPGEWQYIDLTKSNQ